MHGKLEKYRQTWHDLKLTHAQKTGKNRKQYKQL